MNVPKVPGWALERTAFIAANIVCGAILAVTLTALSITLGDTMGELVTGFFSSLVLPVLLVALVLAAGLRRIVLGPARKQTVPATWWTVAYVLASLPLLCAFVLLALEAAVAWAFGWEHRAGLVQALVLLLGVYVVFSFTVKTIANTHLLIRHWRTR